MSFEFEGGRTHEMDENFVAPDTSRTPESHLQAPETVNSLVFDFNDAMGKDLHNEENFQAVKKIIAQVKPLDQEEAKVMDEKLEEAHDQLKLGH
jgi:hypothetical protein